MNAKALVREWKHSVLQCILLLTVATFIDDSLRVVLNFDGHALIVVQLAAGLPPFQSYRRTTKEILAGRCALLLSIVIQATGCLCVLGGGAAPFGCELLILWCVAHPVFYGQWNHAEFLAETVSLIGGLLVLRGYLDKERSGARCRLAGRLLLPSLYAYHAASALSKNLRDEYHAAEHTWAMYAYDACLVAGLVAAVLAVCLGLRSRIVALALALLNLCVVFVEHPFWAYRGVTRRSQLPQAYWNSPIIGEIGAGVAPDQYCDLHQYFFFQGVSTTGALLLLAYHGPGDHAVQSDENVVERLLPAVNRNKD